MKCFCIINDKNIINFDTSKTRPFNTKIHLKALKTTYFKLLFIISFTVLANIYGVAQDLPKPSTEVPVSSTIPEKQILDSIPKNEPKTVQQDSITNDSIAKPKGFWKVL